MASLQLNSATLQLTVGLSEKKHMVLHLYIGSASCTVTPRWTWGLRKQWKLQYHTERLDFFRECCLKHLKSFNTDVRPVSVLHFEKREEGRKWHCSHHSFIMWLNEAKICGLILINDAIIHQWFVMTFGWVNVHSIQSSTMKKERHLQERIPAASPTNYRDKELTKSSMRSLDLRLHQ